MYTWLWIGNLFLKKYFPRNSDCWTSKNCSIKGLIFKHIFSWFPSYCFHPPCLSVHHKSLNAQLLLHVKRGFLKTRHACLFPHGESYIVIAVWLDHFWVIAHFDLVYLSKWIVFFYLQVILPFYWIRIWQWRELWCITSCQHVCVISVWLWVPYWVRTRLHMTGFLL